MKCRLRVVLKRVVSKMVVGERYMLEQVRSCTLFYWELEILYEREEEVKLIS